MNKQERQALRDKHYNCDPEELDLCNHCKDDYPCDVIQVLDILDRISMWANSVTSKWIDPRNTLNAEGIIKMIQGLLTPEPVSETDPKLSDSASVETSTGSEAEAKQTNVFLQYKGTDICLDFRCSCGVNSHFDGMFANHLQCVACKQIYQMPYTLYPVAVEHSEFGYKVTDLGEGEEV